MLATNGHRQAEREPTRNAQRAGEFAERGLSGGDNGPCAYRPRNG